MARSSTKQVIPITGGRSKKSVPGGMRKVVKRLRLQGRDKSGKLVNTTLKATIIEPKGAVKKQATSRDTGSQINLPVSNVEDEDEFRELVQGKDLLIAPPFHLRTLAQLKDNSTELSQAIRSMVVNTVGFGWTLREFPMTEEVRKKFEPQILEERQRISAMMRVIHPKLSFTMLRKQVQEDRHSTGNGYLELISTGNGKLAGMNHAHGHSIRLTKRDKKPTKVTVQRTRPDLGFTTEEVTFNHRFRRYVQVRDKKLVWFKEAGDPRQLDARTGEFAPKGDTIPLRRRATELIHFNIYNPTTSYGVPVWIGNLFSIYGSRAAEEINFNTLSRNNVPSMFVIVENGSLTEKSIERLQEFVESQIQTAANYSKFILLEGESLDEASPNPESFKIKVEPLSAIQRDDELWQQYDQNNRDKVRQSFRLPPIFVGRAEDYTRATADTSRDIADEQIFAPERDDDDHLINRFILSRWGAKFHTFRSNHPNITDDLELIRMMNFAEKSGGMTPRRADRIVRDIFGDDIGPLPKDIDLDRPFSLQFAEAQSAGRAGGGDGGAGDAGDIGKMVDGLINLRKAVDNELDSRALLTGKISNQDLIDVASV